MGPRGTPGANVVARLAILAFVALPLVAVVLATYRFRLVSSWRMDPIPFGLFLAAAFFAGRASKRR